MRRVVLVRRSVEVLAISMLTVVLLPVAATRARAQAGDAALVGQFTAPFEERGLEPRCVRDGEGKIRCTKPTAVSATALHDGRVLYWDGIDGGEGVEYVFDGELDNMQKSRSRVLDLSGERAAWTVPTPEGAGGGTNPDTQKDPDPRGTLGVPGRPGDGLVGSTVGQVVEGPPQSPPEDPSDNDADLFCSYLVMLPDGRLVVFGGTDWYNEPRFTEKYGFGELAGIRNTAVFDPATNGWSQSNPMKYPRFYPAGVTMPDGTIMAIGGVHKVFKNTQLSQVRRTETLDPATMTWAENYTGAASENSLPLFPRLRVMPNGKVFYYGSGEAWAPMGQSADEALWSVMQSYNPQTKAWETEGINPLGMRNLALDVMLPLKAPYDKATVLAAGGTAGPFTSLVSTNLSQEITVDKIGNIIAEVKGELNNLRWGSVGTLLPDGTVFAVNGADIDHLVTPGVEEALLESEIYHPETGRWSRAADASRGRVYHHSAILLADGRVLVGGHSPAPFMYSHYRDMPRTNNDRDSSFQIYSPPYLFRGDRPEIIDTQSGIGWGQTFDVRTDGSEIESVILVRTVATNHMIDNDQRAIFLDFKQTGDHLSVTAPPDGAVAPPGGYYLFVNRKTDQGPVPSVSRLVRVGATPDARPAAPSPFQDSTKAVAGIGATPLQDTTTRMPGECNWCGDSKSADGKVPSGDEPLPAGATGTVPPPPGPQHQFGAAGTPGRLR